MDKRFLSDQTVLVPIGIGIFSIAGILLIALIAYLDLPQTAVFPTSTPTPFRYQLLTTGTFLPDPVIVIDTAPAESLFLAQPTNPIPAAPPATEVPVLPTQALLQASTPSPGPTTSASTPAASATAGSAAGNRYDNADPLLDFDGDWVHQTNAANAHQGTLSVSNSVDDDLVFDFTGQQLVIGYVGGSGQGLLTIYIDDDEFKLNQSSGKEWTSPQYPNEEHFVILVNEDGGSVNLDYINVLGNIIAPQ